MGVWKDERIPRPENASPTTEAIMKRLFASLCLFVLAYTAFGQDFQGIPWGTPIDEIADLKGQDLQTLQNEQFDAVYYYRGTAEGSDAAIFFYEKDGKLVQGAHSFVAAHDEFNGYIDDYQAMKQVLTTRYGPPQKDVVEWKDEQYRAEPASWGRAVSLGHLVYLTEWNTPQSLVRMWMGAENGYIIHSVLYTSLIFIKLKQIESTLDRIESAVDQVVSDHPIEEDVVDIQNLYLAQCASSPSSNCQAVRKRSFAEHLAHHAFADLQRILYKAEKQLGVIYPNPAFSVTQDSIYYSWWAIQYELKVALWIQTWKEDVRRGPSTDQQRLIRQYPEVGWMNGYWCKEGEAIPDHKYETLNDGTVRSVTYYDYGIRERDGQYGYLHGSVSGGREVERVGSVYYDTWVFSGLSKGYDSTVYLDRYEKRSDYQYALVYHTTKEFRENQFPNPDLDWEAKIAFLKEKVRAALSPADYEANPTVYNFCE